MENPRYITRLRSKSIAKMSDTDQNVNEVGESENNEHSEDLDYDSLIDSVESNDSKVILSVLQNQNEKIKRYEFRY